MVDGTENDILETDLGKTLRSACRVLHHGQTDTVTLRLFTCNMYSFRVVTKYEKPMENSLYLSLSLSISLS